MVQRYSLDVQTEEIALHWALVLTGGAGFAPHALNGGTLGARATIALLLLIGSTCALVRSWLRPPRLPVARLRR